MNNSVLLQARLLKFIIEYFVALQKKNTDI